MVEKLATRVTKVLRAALLRPEVVSVGKYILRSFPKVEADIAALVYPIKEKASIPRLTLISQNEVNEGKQSNKENYIPQFMFDVSEICVRNIGSGIPRFVLKLFDNIMSNPPCGYRVFAVRATKDGKLVYAHSFMYRFNRFEQPPQPDTPVVVEPGDIFFSADLKTNFPFATLQNLRAKGLRTIFFLHDLIPLRLNFFHKIARLTFKDWFNGILATSDAIICVSRSVADELIEWLRAHPNNRDLPLPIGYSYPGADFAKINDGQTSKKEEDIIVLHYDKSKPTLLMVGTVEAPRKGYDDALTAMEKIWAKGIIINLIIVGREGWLSHHLIRRISRHPQLNRHLFWLKHASDGILNNLYGECTALLAASLAEGFGIPLIEAAHHGLPIIARDIPVFREVCGEHAFYFPNTNADDLADCIQQWLLLWTKGAIPISSGMRHLSWEQSAKKLLDLIIHDDWYCVWKP